MFAFGLSSSVLSKVSIADFEHVSVCWEMCGITIVVVLILKYLHNKQQILTQSQQPKP